MQMSARVSPSFYHVPPLFRRNNFLLFFYEKFKENVSPPPVGECEVLRKWPDPVSTGGESDRVALPFRAVHGLPRALPFSSEAPETQQRLRAALMTLLFVS